MLDEDVKIEKGRDIANKL